MDVEGRTAPGESQDIATPPWNHSAIPNGAAWWNQLLCIFLLHVVLQLVSIAWNPSMIDKEGLRLLPVAFLETNPPLPPSQILVFGIIDHLIILSLQHMHRFRNLLQRLTCGFMAHGLFEPLPDNLKALPFTDAKENT